MGLWGLLGGLASRAIPWVARKVGQIFHGVRRVAEVGAPVLKGIGNYVKDNHQPLSAGLWGLAEAMPNNPYVGTAAGLGMMGSAALSAMGVGRDYGLAGANQGLPNNMRPAPANIPRTRPPGM
jgi:hypothetical protein